MNTPRTSRNSLLLLAGLTITALGMTGCAATTENSKWDLEAAQEIVAINSQSQLWITGSMWHIDSGNYIDYQYAFLGADNGFKQGLLFDLFNEYEPYSDGIPSDRVTIYQDITAESITNGTAKPRIEVHSCRKSEGTHGQRTECELPSGGKNVDYGDVRIDIHVPKNAVIDVDSLGGKSHE